MQQAKFAFIIFATLLQLVVILHSSILTYVEQQYHNFTESSHPLIRMFSRFYQASMLQNNMVFAYTDSTMEYLQNLFDDTFTQAQKFLHIAQEAPLPTPTKPKTPESPKKTHLKPTRKPPHTGIDSTPPNADKIQEPHIKMLTEQKNAQENKISLEANKDNETAPQSTQEQNTSSFFTHNIPTAQMPQNQSPTQASPQELPKSAQTQTKETEQELIVESYTPIKEVSNPRIHIDEYSSVLLVGDSMMQGVAPYILKTFKKVHLQGINLSKHSTGLTHKHYFDWANAVEEAFNKNDNIALVVVLLGANDPWTMKKNIAFKSKKWEEIYTQRIEEILQIAQYHGARVAWYEVPSVREESLNDKIMYLNSLYEREVSNNSEFFLQSNGIVTQGGKYSAFIKNENGKSVQVRIDDGVHFTPLGYQIMANIFLNALVVRPQDLVLEEAQ